MNDYQDTQPIRKPSEDEDAEEERKARRLDRLMGAKEQEEQKAARWNEIEAQGLPVPSHDQSDVPPPDTLPAHEEDEPPAAYSTPPPERPRPRFPHPTDRPGRPVSPLSEPPPPHRTDEGATEPVVQPRDRQPHHRYQPPPEDVGAVRVDADGMPLPPPSHDIPDTQSAERRPYDDERRTPYDRPTDSHAYVPPAYPESRQETRYTPPPPPPPPTRVQRQVAPYRAPSPPGRRAGRGQRRHPIRFNWGCAVRALVLAFIAGLVMTMLSGGGVAVYYAQVTAPSFEGIDDITDLQSRALQFETTRIRDRDGAILYEINDPHGGFRDYVTLDEISPWMIVATVATEERNFFINPGFSIPDIARALVQNLREGEIVSGASTITQQLTRALLLPETERAERSYQRKIKEAFLAAELGRRFDKREILELYLNQIYYGNLAYGIEAAAQTYFGKSARDLTLAESSFLAGLPQAPAVWDPVTDKDAALHRQQQVLALMLEAGCLNTGNTGLTLPCTTDAELAAAQPDLAAVANREFYAPAIQAKYPHWVVYVQQLLEADPTIGPAIYTSGFDVYTTIDPNLQDLAQQQVEVTLSGLVDRNVNNASVVIIDIDTGAILTMVGSRDFNNEVIDGQVNIALTPQQPGSSIKPFTYLAAFRQGWTPASVIWDVPIEYQIPGYGPYAPVNYDGRFRGPVTVREAIANSLNVPAVQTLDHVGVPALLEVLNDVGISSLGDSSNPHGYGLSLTLGAGEVYLLEWTNAFATIANGGTYRPPYAIQRIERNGTVIEGYPYEIPAGEQAIDPAYAYLLQSIMSDIEARVPSFGRNSPLNTPYPAGAKTGTTNDFRDNWTMGYTTEVAVGVWVGNTDNSPMFDVSGVTGAGPIWRDVMDGAQQWYPAQAFPRPAGVFDQTVCIDDGAEPSQYCLEHSQVRSEIFAVTNPPPAADQSMYRSLRVDTFTGLIANDFCTDYVDERFYVVLPNPSQLIDLRGFERDWLLNTDTGRDWATKRGIPLNRFEQPPDQSCGPDTPRPTLAITAPEADSQQSGILVVRGTADAPNFSHYIVDFGLARNPQGWGTLQPPTYQPVHDDVLGQLDLNPFENGVMTIRLLVYDTAGHSAEVRVTFEIANPTPTPTPTARPPDTPTPTPTLGPPTPSTTPSPTPTTASTETPTQDSGG